MPFIIIQTFGIVIEHVMTTIDIDQIHACVNIICQDTILELHAHDGIIIQ